MRILLTGSSGWLARFLAPMLRAGGHTVVGLDVVPGGHTEIVGSVADSGMVDRIFAAYGIDAVIHAGALHKPDIVRFSEQAFVDVNVTGTLNLLRAAAAAGHDRFVFTSTTSLMVSRSIREERGETAIWLDESSGPLEPRNIYGITKHAAEGLCRLHAERGLNCIVLRTARFFPENDDTLHALTGPNLKANELLHRRLTAEDAAAAHVVALDRAPSIGFGIFVISAPTPFARTEAEALKHDAARVVAAHFPDAPALYGRRGWRLPASIGRIYDSSRAEQALGFRCRTDFGRVLEALRTGEALPFDHDPDYRSPSAALAAAPALATAPDAVR